MNANLIGCFRRQEMFRRVVSEKEESGPGRRAYQSGSQPGVNSAESARATETLRRLFGKRVNEMNELVMWNRLLLQIYQNES